jgi:hypothetical protein
MTHYLLLDTHSQRKARIAGGICEEVSNGHTTVAERLRGQLTFENDHLGALAIFFNGFNGRKLTRGGVHKTYRLQV